MKKLFSIIGLIILVQFSCIKKESPVSLDTPDTLVTSDVLDTLGNSDVSDTSNTSQTSSIYWPDGAIIDAASGSPSDIRAAIESANPGDNIRIPAGTFIIDESIHLEAGVNIFGAGRDKTILQANENQVHGLFVVDGSNGLPVAFSNMKLIGDQRADSDLMDAGILLENGCQDFRITEVECESFGRRGIAVLGISRGVIDNCRFVNNYRPAIGNFGYGVSVGGDGDASWELPLVLGDQNAVFVEDCYFIGNRHAIGSNYGSRYVFRYNLVEDNAAGAQAVDAHGQGFGSSRGSRSYEVYENTIDNANTTCWTAIFIRGGDGVVYNNTIVQGISYAPNAIGLRNENPELDQIRELYIWDNYYQGNLIDVVYNESPTTLEEGRDYFINVQRPEYTPYTYPHPLRGEEGE